MASTEHVPVWFGSVERQVGEDDSSVLARLPKEIYPNPKPACATCPAKDWFVTATELRCYCKERGVISWVSNADPVMACDAREKLIRSAAKNASAAACVPRGPRPEAGAGLQDG